MAVKSIIPKWEFWPAWLFYIPVYIYASWLVLKARNTTFFSLSNPVMKWGGLFAYSKFKILDALPEHRIPLQLLISPTTSPAEALAMLHKKGIAFPLILKPDKGERGKQVAFIENESAFYEYSLWGKVEVIVQEFINWPLEIGVLWIRDMSHNIGFISSLMERSLLTITGNGLDSVEKLLHKNNRYRPYIKKIKERYPQKSDYIPKNGEQFLIEPIGNHSRGTIFLNAMDKIDVHLVDVMNQLLIPVTGFNYGRLDIRTKSWEELKAGRNFKVLEINGANSEPAHIYNPNSSILKAYKTLFQHWKYMHRIAVYNRKKGLVSENFSELFRAFRSYLSDDQS
ncbi:D-alanine--D-alanine ligase [Hyphobacterium sp. CCMP332]|nr:D-alanine--D-alanine ligase [Hyphobacterium sp. CCMP332]